MRPFAPNRKPSFFWQGILITLPVIILAWVGFLSLKQDKALARHDAEQRAQTIADGLLPKCWSQLTNRSTEIGQHGFQVDNAGELVFPPPYAAAPLPQPLSLTELTPAQTRLWLTAQQTECNEKDPQLAIQAYREFLESNPAATFAGAAHYALGLLLAKQDQLPAAHDQFELVIAKYSQTVGESGLLLRPLAQVKLYELERVDSKLTPEQRAHSIELVCSNAVFYPNALSQQILNQIASSAHSALESTAVRKWMTLWEAHELSRELFAAARTELHAETNGLFWFSTPETWKRIVTNTINGLVSRPSAVPPAEIEDRSWLAVRYDKTSTNQSFLCLAESEVGATLAELVLHERQIPDYFGIGIEIAGKKVTRFAPDLRVWHYADYFGRNGGGEKVEYTGEAATVVLASAHFLSADPTQLKLSVFLTSPTTLFRNQHARTFWFAALIASAAIAASIGLVAAYRAFCRQLRLSEMKSNFVSSVSHELRAPIASVRLMAESLESGRISETPKQQEYFRFIVQECRRLSSLIENVLDFSRIEQGRKQYEFELTDLVMLTKRTVQLMEPYAAERQIRLELQLPGLPFRSSQFHLLADGKAIQQALINLIDNAVKHSHPDGKVLLGLEEETAEKRCETAAADSERADSAEAATDDERPEGSISVLDPGSSIPHVLLWVEDYGEGIPQSEHERIFERFYRSGSELRRETQGVGIGLSIVKHIVEAHGGRIRLRSEVGHGSRFTIELPMADGNDSVRF